MQELTIRRTVNGERIGVVVVDDQAVFREVARDVIRATAGFELIGEAASGAEALRCVAELHPDLVLMDVHMPEMDGVQATRMLLGSDSRSVVVLVSLDDRDELPAAVEACGAAAFLRKQDLRPSSLRDLWQIHGTRDKEVHDES